MNLLSRFAGASREYSPEKGLSLLEGNAVTITNEYKIFPSTESAGDITEDIKLMDQSVFTKLVAFKEQLSKAFSSIPESVLPVLSVEKV